MQLAVLYPIYKQENYYWDLNSFLSILFLNSLFFSIIYLFFISNLIYYYFFNFKNFISC